VHFSPYLAFALHVVAHKCPDKKTAPGDGAVSLINLSSLFSLLAYLAFFGKVTAAFFLLLMCVFTLLAVFGELILAVLAGAGAVAVAVAESAAKAGTVMAMAPSTINDVSLVFMVRSL